jgi:tRNA1(Val) A37 N6-methylase TrmN6
VRLNGLDDRVRAVGLDVASPARNFAAKGLRSESIMRVLMNPPFNDPQRQRLSPDAARRLAHAAPRQMLAVWVKAAARLLRSRGTLTAIWRADGLFEMLSALATAFGGITVRPVYSRPDKPAIRILVNAVKGSHAPVALLPPLLLAEASGVPTPAADAVLRDGVALSDIQS